MHQDALEIMSKFREILFSTIESLHQREVSLKEIAFESKSQKSVDQDQLPSGSVSLTDLLPKLISIEDTSQIVLEIFSYCSFVNYHMLEQIITQAGEEKDKGNFAQYKAQFREYGERDLSMCPSEVGKMKEDGFANLFVTLDKVHQQITLNDLQSFIDELQELLNISNVELRLCSIFSTDTVGLMFQIPLSAYPVTFPLSEMQRKALVKLGVVQLSCGDSAMDQDEDEVFLYKI